MKRLLLLVCLIGSSMLSAMAWKDMPMSELKIVGRYLCDAEGNPVNLHGFGQTYSPYFNGYAWCKNSDGSVNWGKTYDQSACVYWNKLQIKKMLMAGWMVNWIRIHMDPHWSNTPGKQTKGENDISAFDFEMFKENLDKVFIPMAEYAIENGIYVVMRPPGVCPQKLTVGDDYQKYLIKVWSYVCNHEKLKNNPYVMFELANEPIDMNDGSGNYTSWSDGSQRNCTKFFQQIVDAIRGVGAKNILWVPGLAYQQNYQGYAKYPIVGENIGYAVHCYPGWYGSDSEVASAEQGIVTNGHGYAEFQAGWNASLGELSKKSPILITEMDWAPKKYNNSWGKATTGELGGVGFGANFKYIMDKTGNVSWMLFTDADKLAAYDDSKPDGDTFLTSPEACVRPIYRWYKEYADPNWKFEDVLKAQLYFFPGTDDVFSPNIWETGSLTQTPNGGYSLVTGQYGFGGWQFAKAMDFSQYKYLVVKLDKAPASSAGWSLRLFDHSSYWTDPSMTSCAGKTTVVVRLNSMYTEKNVKVDPKNIYILGFWSMGGTPLYINSIYLTNNDDYSDPTDVTPVELAPASQSAPLYTVTGQRVKSIADVPAGTMIISNGRKYIAK